MKILVVDDHEVVRQGVVRLLGALSGSHIREADNAEDAFSAFRKERPDVVVLDINLRESSGLDLLRRMRFEDSAVRAVIFSMYTDAVYANSARRAGALGYVSKSAPADQLLTAVNKAARGESFIDSDLAAEMDLLEKPDADPVGSLSGREIEVLRLLGDGKGLNDIAETLGIAYKTVANTCTRVKEKLGMERTGDLIRFAVENRHNRLSDKNLDRN